MTDADDVRARVREGATRIAARAYEAAHGAPISDDARGARWRMEPRVAASVAVVAVALAWAALAARPAGAADSVPWEAAPSAATAPVVVHVAGAVASPGVVELDAGARVLDAIADAGGLLDNADASAINLARVLVDGEQVYVPVQGDGGDGSAAVAGKVNLNRASAAELEALPGIGPVLAARIVDDRRERGPYGTVADVARVEGVGPALVARLAELATV